MSFLTTRGNANAMGRGQDNEPEDYHEEPEIWLRNKKRTMRGEDLSTYSGKMGLSCPKDGSHAEDISHIMRHGKKSCKFVSLILNPLLEELDKLNYQLNDLGIPPNPSRSINEVKHMIDEKNKSDHPDEYSFVQSRQNDMRNEDLSTYSRRGGLCSNTYTGYVEEVRHIQRRRTASCNFVPLILNPLLIELDELNQELSNLGVQPNPSRSINRVKHIIAVQTTHLMTKESTSFGQETSSAQEKVFTTEDTNKAIRDFLGGKKIKKRKKKSKKKRKKSKKISNPEIAKKTCKRKH